MPLILDIAGVVLLLQGISPLIQRMSGQDPKKSFFIVNSLSHYQPLASIALILLGAFFLFASQRIRRRNR